MGLMSTEIIGQISQQPLQIIGNISSSTTPINVEIIGVGATGAKGQDGYSPVKGIDYYTDDDTAQIITLCINAVKQDAKHVHDQIVPSTTWTIDHNLNKFPSVTVIDSVNNVVVGDIEYVSNSQIILTFSVQFSGKAFLN